MDSAAVRGQLYTLAFLQHDEADMTRQLDAGRKLPDGYRMLAVQLSCATYLGQLSRARELARQFASESTAKLGLKGAAALLWSNVAQAAAPYGDAAAARDGARRSLDLARNVTTLLYSAFALTIVNDVAAAQKLIDEARAMPTASTEDAQRGLQLLDALMRMRRGDRTAVNAVPPPKNDFDTAADFLAGIAQLQTGGADAAAKHFKRVIDRGLPSTSSLAALAPLYYGRSLVKLGQIDESRKAYDRFLDTWKNADADLPMLVAAKQEYARLK